MSEPLKIVFVGAGFIAGKHCSLLKQRPDVRIVGACDTAPGIAARLLEEQGLPGARGYTDLETLLDKEQPDLAYVCLPPFAHDGQVEKLAAQGVHLFVEKPIALDSTRAARMVAAVDEAGVKSQVGFHMRFLKSVRLLCDKISSGEAGRPLLFDGRYWANFSGKAWWKDQSRSGGQIFEQVCHIYDTARYLLGEPVRAHGALARLGHEEDSEYTVEDTSASLITFADGAVASITGSNCALPTRFVGDFRVVCERAVLDFHSEGDWRVPDEAKLWMHDGGEIAEPILIREDGDPFAAETEDLIRAIREDRPTVTPIREGLETIRLIERVRDEQPIAARQISPA